MLWVHMGLNLGGVDGREIGAEWVNHGSRMFRCQTGYTLYVYVGAGSSLHMHGSQQGCMHLYRAHMRLSSEASYLQTADIA